MMGRMGGPGPRQIGQIERAKDRRGTVARLWGYLWRQRRTLVLTAICVVASSALGVYAPYLLSRAIDGYVLSGDLPGLWRRSPRCCLGSTR